MFKIRAKGMVYSGQRGNTPRNKDEQTQHTRNRMSRGINETFVLETCRLNNKSLLPRARERERERDKKRATDGYHTDKDSLHIYKS